MVDAAKMLPPECRRTDNLLRLRPIDENRGRPCIRTRHVVVECQAELLCNPRLRLEVVMRWSWQNFVQDFHEKLDRALNVLRLIVVFPPGGDLLRSLRPGSPKQRQNEVYHFAPSRLGRSPLRFRPPLILDSRWRRR